MQQFPGFIVTYFGDGGGDKVVDVAVERIEFALMFANFFE
jgi:hypothetical protein